MTVDDVIEGLCLFAVLAGLTLLCLMFRNEAPAEAPTQPWECVNPHPIPCYWRAEEYAV